MKTNRAIFINPGNPESIWNAELTGAVATVTATEIDRVIPCLREAEKLRESGYFVAGYIAYEAAPSLDPKMTTHPPSSLPLCHFTAFEKMRKPSPPFSKESGFAISKLQEEISDDDYLARVLLVKDLISRGDVYQVNLTYRLRGRFEGSSLTLFSEILEKVDFPYCAFLDSQEWSILSFSPELFFHVKGNRIKTSPMKGTAPRGATEEEDVKREKELSESLKNASENLMIVDLLRNDLGKICLPGSVRVPSLFRVEKYRTLFQMVTDIVGELSGRGSLEEILRALFPCGSITGTPKIRSMEIIREVEKSPRGVYTGAIGLLMPTGESIFSVAIRTATVLKRARLVEFGTGGGIVFDSSPAEELEETKLKSLFFRSHDSSFSLLETVLYEKGKGFFLLEEHEKRMEEGATYFSFPFQKSEFRKSLEKAVTGLRWEKAVVRILLDREGRFSWTVTPIKEEEIRPWTVRVIPADFDPSSPFVLHKTTVRDHYESALSENPDVDDVIFVSPRGEVTESTRANVVIRKGTRLFTPRAESGLLKGTFREKLIREGKIEEARLTVGDLLSADEVFLVNSVRKWIPAVVVGVDSRVKARQADEESPFLSSIQKTIET